MIRIRFSAVILCVTFAFSAQAGDMDAMTANCNGCHGDDGVSQWDDVPTIAGLPQFSHADALYLYRDGERPCVESDYRQGDTSRAATSMCDVVADMDDDAIEEIADHYAAMPFIAAAQEFDADLASAGAAIHDSQCDRCHSDAGTNIDDEASILGGQWMGYLRTSFEQYASGDRWQDDKMAEKVEELSADDIEALVHFYGSQQ